MIYFACIPHLLVHLHWYGLVGSCFTHWVVICQHHPWFCCSNYPRFNQWAPLPSPPMSFGIMWFFEIFLTFWHNKIFQAHLLQPWSQLFLRRSLAPFAAEWYLEVRSGNYMYVYLYTYIKTHEFILPPTPIQHLRALSTSPFACLWDLQQQEAWIALSWITHYPCTIQCMCLFASITRLTGHQY